MLKYSKVLGALSFVVLTTGAAPAEWYQIADEISPNFTTSTPTVVHYGSGSSWTQRTVLGNGVCSSAFFGRDPIRGVVKKCKVFGVPPVVAPLTVGLGKLPANPVINAGTTDFRVLRTGQLPPNSRDGTGNFRTRCALSHYAFDDPIVFPGQPGRSHLHAFLGNTSIDAFTTPSTIRSEGGSTCRGGSANLSGYWVPAMIDTVTNLPVNFLESDVYYKSSYKGVSPKDIKPIPAGLVMIAGDAKNTTEDPYTSPYLWSCHNNSSIRGQKIITSCPAGDQLEMGIFFPQCWDGKNLDSPDHKSHMSYPGPVGCPASHPVALPEVSIHILWSIPASGDMSKWRLSSDTYTGPAGYSAHADFMVGWDRSVIERWTKFCVVAAKDCASHILGDGWTIY